MIMETLENNSTAMQKKPMGLAGKVTIGVCGSLTLALVAGAAPFVSPALRKICIPYVPATTQQVKNVMKMLKPKTGSSMVDLGSGDGRIVLEAARQGMTGHGIELNPWLVIYSRLKAMQLGLRGQTAFHRKDLWKADLTQYNYIVIFGAESMMDTLEDKLNREISPINCVIACRFPLPNWTPITTLGEGLDTVWLYTKESKKSSNKQ